MRGAAGEAHWLVERGNERELIMVNIDLFEVQAYSPSKLDILIHEWSQSFTRQAVALPFEPFGESRTHLRLLSPSSSFAKIACCTFAHTRTPNMNAMLPRPLLNAVLHVELESRKRSSDEDGTPCPVTRAAACCDMQASEPRDELEID